MSLKSSCSLLPRGGSSPSLPLPSGSGSQFPPALLQARGTDGLWRSAAPANADAAPSLQKADSASPEEWATPLCPRQSHETRSTVRPARDGRSAASRAPPPAEWHPRRGPGCRLPPLPRDRRERHHHHPAGTVCHKAVPLSYACARCLSRFVIFQLVGFCKMCPRFARSRGETPQFFLFRNEKQEARI